MNVPLDQPVRLTFDTSVGAVLTDPTTVAVTIRDPAGVETTFTWAASQVVKDSTGVFHYDYLPTAVGAYAAHWKATGAVATSRAQTFTVLSAYDVSVSVDDLAAVMNNPDLDSTRAGKLLDFAQTLCETVVKPLPAGSEVVILDVAQRAYAVPPEGVGPFATIEPTAMTGGLFLTRANKKTLRRLNGGGSAFSVDLLPAVLPTLPAWDLGTDASLLDIP